MLLNMLSLRKSLNKAFLKQKPNRKQIDDFKNNLFELKAQINDQESEEFHKNLISHFLKKTYYDPDYYVNTKGRNDLVIHNGKTAKSSVGIIIETKKPTNKSEMLRKDNINTKAFHELILYYLRERIKLNNLELKHIIATNLHEWFIFDASLFEKLFVQNKSLVKQFNDFEEGRLAGTTTDFFYKEIAASTVEKIESEISFTYFNLNDYKESQDSKLVPLFKIFSPEHLLKLPFENDSNSLDKKFYNELLHIIGLEEVKDKSKKLIKRKEETKRDPGSLLENAIHQLDSRGKLARLDNPQHFGDTQQERLFNVGLELVITWVNRILFLKLLEAQLLKYHKQDKKYAFLNYQKIRNFDDLDNLFLDVLACKYENRSEEALTKFQTVPYLNSSLFEETELEHATVSISNLRDDRLLSIYQKTVLKDSRGKKISGEQNAIEYLFSFLDAYDFSSEGSEDIQEESKTLINASVLGLIFEKINGYKDGSFFTPGFITMYMCKETIRRAVVQKFNDFKNWNCSSLGDIYNKIEDKSEANEIINSLKICDPAVGSGHFLVSALNEIISIKSYLKILMDKNGKILRDYNIDVENDELVISDEDGLLFEYHPGNSESQRVQETLFHEKQTIIENCLFGVDINHNSVKICRLRLWIELLKNSYYKTETKQLETLPNIDINIKCGNSLISRYALDADLKKALKKSKWNIDTYRRTVRMYQNASSKEEKHSMEELINKIKNDFVSEIAYNDKRVVKRNKLQGELFSLENQQLLFESDREKNKRLKRIKEILNNIEKIEKELDEIQNNKIYENAFEWRFEFPEVLNNDGDFIGFDVVIGNPPWGASFEADLLNIIKSTNYDIIVRMTDSFMFFVNLALNIRNKSSFNICQIIPDVILYQQDNTKLRDKLLSQTQLELAYNLGDNIFEDVARPSCIIITTSNKSKKTFVGNYNNSKLEQAFLTQIDTSFFATLPNHIITTKNIQHYKILNKYQKLKLMQVLDEDNIQRGVSPDLKKAFVVNNSEIIKNNLEKNFIYPTITGGRDLESYYTQLINKNIIYTTKYDNPERIVNIIKYIEQYRNEITCKEVQNNKHPIWALHRPRKINIFQKKEKIIGVITGDKIITMLDDKQLFPTDGLYLMNSNGQYSNKFLVGLLNSKLATFFYRLLSMEENRTLSQIKPVILQNLPLGFSNNNPISEMENLTTKIINTKQSTPYAKTADIEAQIDQLVYKLYNLTDEEIKIVEDSVK